MDYVVKKVVGGFGLGDGHVVRFATINFGDEYPAGVNNVFIFIIGVECVPVSFTGVSVSP